MIRIDYRWSEYQNYEFGSNGLEEVASVGAFGEDEEEFESDEEESEDCLEHILTYAGFDESQIEDVRNKIREYRELPDMLSTDDEAYRIRKQLTPVFYDVYYKVFMRAMQEEGQITPILEMFLNFGFMDVQMVSRGRHVLNLIFYFQLPVILKLFHLCFRNLLCFQFF